MNQLLVTVGPPRCGTTLAGQILRTHPDVIVASNSRGVQNIARFNKNLHWELLVALSVGLAQEISFHKRSSSPSWRQYQPKWIATERARAQRVGLFFRKGFFVPNRGWLVVKKSGNNAEAFASNAEKFRELLQSENGIWFFVSRNPEQAAASYAKSHPHEVGTLDEARERIDRLNRVVHEMRLAQGIKLVELSYEAILDNPHETISGLYDDEGLRVVDSVVSEATKLADRRSDQ